MKTEKISKNTYRVRKMIKGISYSVTFDHKPSQKEILFALSEDIEAPKQAEKGSLKEYCNKYINDKSNVLKSSTMRGYDIIINNLPDWLAKKQLREIEEEDIEKYVNDMAARLAPKTIRNRYYFIVSVITKYNKRFNCSATLPMVVDKDTYIPTKEDIQAIITAISGTEYEIPIKLAVLGLRQSEIGGLSIDDIKNGRAYIHQALTQGRNNKWVLEESNKTASSTRYVQLPKDLYNLIIKQGYIYNGSLHTIYDVLDRTCKQLNIPHISIHKLRHFYASYCHQEGYTEAQIMEMGGWSTPNVMKKVYRHAMETQKAQQELADSLGSLFTKKKTGKKTGKKL